MRYNINKISRRFFPWFWQNDVNLRLIDLLMSSLSVINRDTETFEIDTRERVRYSIQRLSLESSLNTRFDNELRRITIENGEIGGSEFVYNESENPLPEDIIFIFNENEATPPGENTPFFFNNSEAGTGAAVSFTVFAPASLSSMQQQLEAWINLVLIYGTTYTIKFI